MGKDIMYGNRMQQEFEDRDVSAPVRLNKYLSEAGICSRREADRLIEMGKVLVDGRPAFVGQKVTAGQQIEVEGRQAQREKQMVLLMVNKPRGVVCSTDDRWGDVTIDAFLNYPKRIFPIGRLDKDSEGLLLMTNYGEILNKIMRAGNYHEKEYQVEIDRPVTEQFLKKMSRGVWLEELHRKTRPCKVCRLGERQFSIILTQGLNRQIRRMCQACGAKVKSLKRIRIMSLELGDLKTGEYRELTDAEIAKLYEEIKESRA